MNRRFAFLMIMWVGLMGAVYAAPSTTTNWTFKLQGAYETDIKKILDEGEKQIRACYAEYLKEIAALRTKTQKDGDLDGVLAIDAELKRFQATKDFPDPIITTFPETIGAIQLAYCDRPKQLAQERDQKVVKLTNRYREVLTATQTAYTKANKIADALLVNAELKRVAALPAVIAAEASMAEVDAKKVPDEIRPPDPKPSKANVTPPPKSPPRENKEEARLADGFSVVKKSAGMNSYKKLALTPAPLFRMSNMRVECGTDEVAGSKKTYGDSYYNCREGNTKLKLQTTLHIASSTNEYENAKMVIQYFTRDLSNKSSGLTPSEEKLKVITPLPRVSTKPVTIECPPFQYWSSTSRYSSYYYPTSSHSYGDDFQGIVVSVFDKDGKLLYQGASVNSILKEGVTSL